MVSVTTTTTIGPTDWWRLAACVGHDPEWWSDDLRRRVTAVRICVACPVRQWCLKDAIAGKDIGVVRAGVLFERTPNGRRMTNLICVQCDRQPVQIIGRPTRSYCGKVCQVESEGERDDRLAA
jgi:hypothetical protein